MLKIFVLANGRTGTKYLSKLFKYNVKDCVSKHEPFPDMFGKPIYWYQQGNTKEIVRLFNWKKNRINKYKASVYIETNHAFLKSFCNVAIDSFPDMKLIHLIRNPIKTAKSELNRHLTFSKLHIPFSYARGFNGKKYSRYALTGDEDIYKSVDGNTLTLFQKYVLQWIEIENRAISFLDKYKKHDDCFTMHSPKDLNDYNTLEQMFKFFNLELKNQKIIMKGNKNKNVKPTIITDEDKKQFEEIIDRLPDKYLKIFQKEPYIKYEWASLLKI
ncbi:MAG: hypothetical protein QHH15_02710 [Candidatus Thermoplasmatota archaeon]|jgi:hypothetical protein|nr:hypothetical protein [Candidatus Thermoplasmatota archaeon]